VPFFLKTKIKNVDVVPLAPDDLPQSSTPAFALSIGGNVILAGVFLSALLDPIAHVNLIVGTGIWIFLIEFLSIFVSGGVGRAGARLGSIMANTVGFFVVSIFALAFGWGLFRNLSLPLIFLGSTATKVFGKKATAEQTSGAHSILILLGSVFIVFVVLSPELLTTIFPFPEEFAQYVPTDWATRRASGEISGEFIDRPQTMLAWGVIYFTLTAVTNLVLFKKNLP